MFTFFRQKNIRTKGSFKGRMYIQASLMFICSLNVCTCGAMSATAFVIKNRSGGCYCSGCYSVITGRDQDSGGDG